LPWFYLETIEERTARAYSKGIKPSEGMIQEDVFTVMIRCKIPSGDFAQEGISKRRSLSSFWGVWKVINQAANLSMGTILHSTKPLLLVGKCVKWR